MKRIILKAACVCSVALFAISCQNDGDQFINPSHPAVGSVSFQSEISTRATDTKFEAGDQISVTAYNDDGSIFHSNANYTYGADVFTSVAPIKYENTEHQLSFRAVYPYAEVSQAGAFSFEIKANQNEGTNYTLSDLMSSYAGETQSTTPSLIFNHLLTRVVINVTKTDVALDEAVASVVAQTAVDYNLITSTSTVKGETMSITMAKNGTNSYKAIIPPQNIAQGLKFGSITVGGEVYDFSFEFGKLFSAGKQYSFDMEIKDGAIKFISSSINNWDDGDNSVEGEATFALDQVSSSSYPENAKKWIITDATATYEQMAGLRDALYAMRYSTTKVMLEFPNLKVVPNQALYDMDAIESISLPVATTISEYAFFDCDALAIISLPLVAVIEKKAFQYCTALTTLTIATESSPAAFGDLDADIFNGITLSNVTVTVGKDIIKHIDRVKFPITGNKHVLYGPFASIIGGKTEQMSETTMLADYSSSNYPLDTDTWVINDKAAPLASFIGLNEALRSIESTGRKINVVFQNLEKFPVNALNIDNIPLNSIYSVDAPNVTEIAAKTFYNCGGISSVNLPKLSIIPDQAFFGCKSLRQLVIPAVTTISKSAFENCSSLISVSAESLTFIDELAFKKCTALKSFTAPSVVEIGSSAFYGCNSIQSISFPLAKTIGNAAFGECGNLAEVNFPAVDSLGGSVFMQNFKLEKASFPLVTSISWDFRACRSLKEVNLPLVTKIESYSFSSCISITSLSLPSVITVGDRAFEECSSLQSISMPLAETIGEHTFFNCTSLETISLPSAKVVGDFAFANCTSMIELDLSSATEIGEKVFFQCSSITDINLPKVVNIDTEVFYKCGRLQSIRLPLLSSINTVTRSWNLYPGGTAYATAPIFVECYMLNTVEIASGGGVKLTQFGGSEDLFDGIDISYMTLITGSANKGMKDGNLFTAPTDKSGNGEPKTYGPFLEIKIIN